MLQAGKDWQTLYGEAICERNSSILLQRVCEAERAILVCQQELYSVDEGDERERLDDALYTLRALKTALQYSQVA